MHVIDTGPCRYLCVWQGLLKNTSDEEARRSVSKQACCSSKIIPEIKSPTVRKRRSVCFVDHRNEMAYVASASNDQHFIPGIVRVQTRQTIRVRAPSGEICSEQAVGYKRRGPEAALASNACETDALDVSDASCAPSDANCPRTEEVAEVSERRWCRRKERTIRDEVGGARLVGEGGNDGDTQGLAKHNQFLWAKKMGQQNEPRCGFFKQVKFYYVCVLLLLHVPSYYCISVCILQ